VRLQFAHKVTKQPSTKKEVKEEQKELIDLIKEKINKDYGAGTLVRGSEAVGLEIPKFSTGVVSMDVALLGGFAEGRQIEVQGRKSVGKNTLIYHAAVQYMRKYPQAFFMDMSAEREADIEWMMFQGIDPKRVLIGIPTSGEQAGDAVADTIAMIIEADGKLLALFDSISALTPQSQLDRDLDESNMGRHAHMITDICMRLTSAVKVDLLRPDPHATIVFTNQLRHSFAKFGDPWVATGGLARENYVSQMIRISEGKKLVRELGSEKTTLIKEAVGQRNMFKVLKNKARGPQQITGEFTFFNRGFKGHTGGTYNNSQQLIDLSLVYGLAELHTVKKRAHLDFPCVGMEFTNDKIAGAKAEAIATLEEGTKPYQRLYKALLKEAERRFWNKEDTLEGNLKEEEVTDDETAE